MSRIKAFFFEKIISKKLIWRRIEKGSHERKTRKIRAVKGKVRRRPQVPWCDLSEQEGSHWNHPMLGKRCTWPLPEFMVCHPSDCLSLLKLTIIDPSCWRPVQQPWVQRATQSHHGTMCLAEFNIPMACGLPGQGGPKRLVLEGKVTSAFAL